MMSSRTALEFVAAINTHDVPRIVSLMSGDHIFIRAYGSRENRAAMEQGRPGYSAWFPDYTSRLSK